MKQSILFIGSEDSLVRNTDIPVKVFSPETQRLDLASLCAQNGITSVIAPAKYVDLASQLLWDSESVNSYVLLDTDNSKMNESYNLSLNTRMWNTIAMQAAPGDMIAQAGWKSADTGKTFSVPEMEEFADNVLAKLRPYLNAQSRVLEIGVGSGLICKKIAPLTAKYYGSDFSAETLKKTAAMLHEHGLTNTELFTSEAMSTRELAIPEVDVIILNSVAQYFPGKNYFLNVLESAIAKLKTSGVIFVGDIIDFDKRADYGRIHKARREQYYSRDFITSIPYYVDGVVRAEVSGKLGTLQNELLQYRYDALLSVDRSYELLRGGEHINV